MARRDGDVATAEWPLQAPRLALTVMIEVSMKTWWRAVAAYPPTWVAMAVVAIAVVVALVLLGPPALLGAAVLLTGAVAVALWFVLLHATGTLSRLRQPDARLPEVGEIDVEVLAEELDRLEDPRPAYQLQAIVEKRDNLLAILGSRLDARELTYARYQSTAQQVYVAVITNLREVAIAKRSISTIDTDYIDARLERITSEDSPEVRVEISSLEDRRDLVSTQEAKVTYLLNQNETAMTLLDRTATALADAPIGLAPHEAEEALAALRQLADRAGRYAAV